MARDDNPGDGDSRTLDAKYQPASMAPTANLPEASAPPPLPPGRPSLEVVSLPGSKLPQGGETHRMRGRGRRERSSSALFVWQEPAAGGPTSRPDAIPPSSPPRRPLPLPPAPEPEAPVRPHVRRPESVIAEAAAEKYGMRRVGALARKASVQIQRALDGSLDAAAHLRHSSLQVVRQFEAMPRRRQLLWVALPYIVVIGLVVALVRHRGVSHAATVIHPIPSRMSAEPHRAAAAQVETMAAVREAGGADAVVERPTLDGTSIVSPPNAALAAPPSPLLISPLSPKTDPKMDPNTASDRGTEASETKRGEAAPGIWQTARVDTILRSRPDGMGPRVGKIRAKTRVLAHPDFPAPPGWTLVERSGGDVGFVRTSVFEGSEELEASPKGKKKPKRARRARGSKAPRPE